MSNPILPFALFPILNAVYRVSPSPLSAKRSPITQERVQRARRILRGQWAKILGGVVLVAGVTAGVMGGVITSELLAIAGGLTGILTSGYGAFERVFIGPEEKRVINTARRMKKKGIPLRSEHEPEPAIAAEVPNCLIVAPVQKEMASPLEKTTPVFSPSPAENTANASQVQAKPVRPVGCAKGDVQTLEDDS